MKKSFLTLSCGLLLWAGCPFGSATPLLLRYEWLPDLSQPFVPVPESAIKVHPDGTATVETGTPNAYFRVLIDDGTGAGGGSAPVQPLSTVPPLLVETAREWIAAVAAEDSEEGRAWTGVELAPFVTLLTSAWNDSGVPDLAEIKLTADCPAPPQGSIFGAPEGEGFQRDRGFILVSLSRKNPPMVGYSTEGTTPSEDLLALCRGKTASCLRRFGPACLVAEDKSKNVLAQDGLVPVVFPDATYLAQAAPLDYAWSSEDNNPRRPDAPPPGPGVLDFPTFNQWLAGYAASQFLADRREQRAELIEFDWLCLEGKAPELVVPEGGNEVFFDDEKFSRVTLEDEESERPATVTALPGGGVAVDARIPGVWRLTLFPNDGTPRRYLLRVSKAGLRLPRDDNGPWVTTTQVWQTGPEAEQPRFSQRADLGRWCDAVGCGPVMLALMQTWSEHHQNVPSAYWERSISHPLADKRASLREVDSPLEFVAGVFDTRMVDWYDYWHEQCDVTCWDHNGAGSTLPWDITDALEGYVNYATSPLMPLQVAADGGGPLVGASWRSVIDSWGDDWDEAGVAVANAIKAGRPGGVYYMEHWHYAMAWRYRRTARTLYVGDTPYKTFIWRQFRVNTGWGKAAGKKDRVWNAYDIDGCWLLNMWQKRQLPL